MRGWGGDCVLVVAIRTLMLADFDSGGLLAIDIPTLVSLVFLLSLACPFLCNDDIKYEHAHNRHTGGGACKLTT